MTITSMTTRFRTEWVQDWVPQALCRTSPPDAMFVRGAAQQVAKQTCRGCPVVAECLADALDHRTEFGVWGGMTERERRAMLRRHPDVTSWSDLFRRARADAGWVDAERAAAGEGQAGRRSA